MCIVTLAWQVCNQILLFLIFNHDELHDRPSTTLGKDCLIQVWVSMGDRVIIHMCSKPSLWHLLIKCLDDE
ncbi:hypothetical protein M2R47_00955 [Moraxella sp. Tifton1]|uniref:hypothetical protein n=1 Tax=Moraxella oculi TaxID=2940516 RepID=UPI0020114FB7|nr:hypothetical protein [Moraxella sp. Tifton1]MCL1622824.1 hypothetical protein [Moraxella sp. Tifton1]